MQPKGSERWRWSVKVAIAATIARACSLPVFAAIARAQRRPLILGYHRVVENFDAVARTEMPNMLISRSMFERHLDWLARDFRFVGLDEIGDRAANGIPFSEPVVAITFDDGYRDVYEHAFPILARRGIPGAAFVVTDLVGKPFWQLHDKLYHLVAKAFDRWDDPRRELFGLLNDLHIPPDEVLRARTATKTPLLTVSALLPSLRQEDVRRVTAHLESAVGNGAREIPRTMTWHMLKTMRKAGFTIASHTKTHASLPMETPEAVTYELEGSKKDLERQLGEPVVHFAYPGGLFTPAIVDSVVAAGYRFAYTACRHGDPRHPAATLERLLLSEGSSIDNTGQFSADVLNCQAHDLWPPARRCERVHHA